jgi:DNA-binding MarR family transcriptional regulator
MPNLISFDELIKNFKPPSWLVEGILQRGYIYALTAQTGQAKTAVALLLTELIATTAYDRPMLGDHAVRKGKVLYLIGENCDDVIYRVIGAKSANGGDKPWRAYALPGIFDIPSAYDDLHAHCRTLQGVDLVIIDTSAAYYPGADENSNTEIGEHARAMRVLTELPGNPTVLVLCHPKKYVLDTSELQPRGGGAFIAEMDGNLTLHKLGDTNTFEMSANKLRGPPFQPLTFKIDRVETPALVDDLGKPFATVRAKVLSGDEAEVETTKVNKDDLQILALWLREPDATIGGAAESLQWFYDDMRPDRSRVQRSLARLEKQGMVKKQLGRWILTDKGKTAARDAAQHLQRERERDTIHPDTVDDLPPDVDDFK